MKNFSKYLQHSILAFIFFSFAFLSCDELEEVANEINKIDSIVFDTTFVYDTIYVYDSVFVYDSIYPEDTFGSHLIGFYDFYSESQQGIDINGNPFGTKFTYLYPKVTDTAAWTCVPYNVGNHIFSCEDADDWETLDLQNYITIYDPDVQDSLHLPRLLILGGEDDYGIYSDSVFWHVHEDTFMVLEHDYEVLGGELFEYLDVDEIFGYSLSGDTLIFFEKDGPPNNALLWTYKYIRRD